mgnify:FL=1
MTNQAIPAWAVPGARVVCINAKADYAWDAGEAPTESAVYTIKSTMLDSYGDRVLHLIELRRTKAAKRLHGARCGYRIERFRPAVEPKSEAHDVALFEDIVRGMSLVERLDRIAETLDA